MQTARGRDMDNKLVFIFYAAAVACFLLAALQDSGRLGGSSRGALARVALVPIGLALYVFPQMWNVGVAAF